MQKYRFAIATGENHLIRVDKRIKFIVYTSLCRVSSANYASHRRQLAWIVLGRVYRSAAVQLQRMQQANRIDVCANFLLFGLKTRRASTLAREREGRINNIHFFRSIFFTKAADFSLYNPICPRIPHIRSLLHDKRDSSRAISQVRMKILIRSLRFFARVKTRRYRDGVIRGISTPLAN